MYTRWLPFLKEKNIILGSGSPRRRELLTELGINFKVVKSEFPENLKKEGVEPKKYVEETCLGKFNYFLEHQKVENCDILITADSIVEFNNKILEKPKSKEECKAWFMEYSGNKVIAYTYMVIGVIDKNRKCIAKRNFLSTTYVIFDKLSEKCIDDYINSDEPYDKAGGFGIQANAKSLIVGIEGDFYNVVGFPVNAFTKNLTSLLEEVYGKK